MKYCPVCETDYPDDVTVCPQDGAMVRRPGERSDPFVGRVIKGRYRVERQLGQGGMGAVYLAEQLSIGRKVALKVLRGDFARDDGFVARFRQEAKLVAALNEKRNPRVTLVHDFDQAEDGSLFIVMEWLEGRVLSDVIQREGALQFPRALRLATQIAEGLEAAHRAGVVHRDVKPQNIMVLDVTDDIKLMDFGIARLRDSSRTSFTRAGTIMGTPDYMSPEQIEGQEVTDKTDIYSFGIVFYEMLTGAVPFRANTHSAVLTKQLREQPTPPTGLRPDIPPELEAIVLKALEKDPVHRQRDMDEIVRALREMSRQLSDRSRTESAAAPPTVVAGSVGRAPLETVIVAAPPGQLPTASETWVSRVPASDVHTTIAEPVEHARGTLRSPSRLIPVPSQKLMIIAGAGAAVVVVAVALWAFVIPSRPLTPAPRLSDARPQIQEPSPAQMPPGVPPVSPSGGGDGLQVRPPESFPVPETTPAQQKPRADVKTGPVGPKAASQARPPTPAPKPSVDATKPTVASKQELALPNANRLREQIEERLRSRGLLRGSGSDPETGVSLEVSSEGVVTLRGIVRDATQRDEAARLARVSGVTDVRLRVNVQSSWN
jgi:serine/threonine protein kinase